MDEGKEIKLDKEAFNRTISKLTEYKNSLVAAHSNLVKVNANLKAKWQGDGGTAFVISANLLEERLLKTINDLQEEANDLKTANESLFGTDYNLATSIESAIDVSNVSARVTDGAAVTVSEN